MLPAALLAAGFFRFRRPQPKNNGLLSYQMRANDFLIRPMVMLMCMCRLPFLGAGRMVACIEAPPEQ